MDGLTRSNLDTVYYELWMVNRISRHFTRIDTEEEQVEKNARLESFLLHVRNLVEFLEAPEQQRKGRKKKRDEALWSDDFLDESGNPIQGINVDLPEKDKGDLHKYLSHMTKTRVTKRTWDVAEILQKVNAATKEFLDMLNPGAFPSKEQKTKRDFDRLLDSRC